MLENIKIMIYKYQKINLLKLLDQEYLNNFDISIFIFLYYNVSIKVFLKVFHNNNPQLYYLFLLYINEYLSRLITFNLLLNISVKSTFFEYVSRADSTFSYFATLVTNYVVEKFRTKKKKQLITIYRNIFAFTDKIRYLI